MSPFASGPLILLLSLAISGCSGNGSANTSPSSPVIQQTLPTQSVAAAQAMPADFVLSWHIPTTREDNSNLALADITGYEISYTDSKNQLIIITIDNPLQTEYHLAQLTPDNYQFNIFTYDNNNQVSLPSITVNLSEEQFPISRAL